MVKVNVWLLGKTLPWYSGEIRAALQINSENLLGHKVIFQALRAVINSMVLVASDNVKYWELEYGTSFKGDIPKFYSNVQLPNNRFL